jgi:hypothetical protein
LKELLNDVEIEIQAAAWADLAKEFIAAANYCKRNVLVTRLIPASSDYVNPFTY